MAKAKKSVKVKSQKKKSVKKKNAKKPLKKKSVKASGARRPVVAASPRKRIRSRLAQSTINKFREILLTLKERISGDFISLRNTHLRSSQRDSTGDLSGYSLHMADVGTDAYAREFGISVASSEQDILYRIDRALERIEEKTYGLCEACGCAIKVTRIKAVPWARMCIKCKVAEERERGSS